MRKQDVGNTIEKLPKLDPKPSELIMSKLKAYIPYLLKTALTHVAKCGEDL